MIHTRIRFSLVIIGASLIAIAALGFAEQSPSRPVGRDWTDRLVQLSPEQPMAYFELAEDVADSATNTGDKALARQLFGLAGALDRGRLGRSACLALADMAEDALDRRRFQALATLLDDRGSFIASPGAMRQTAESDAALAVSQAFSYYRQGNGTRALASLREPGAMELLQAHEQFIRGGVARFLEDCRSYRGNLRPTLSDRELLQLLELERALLSGEHPGWASDLMLHAGQPLIEVDPASLDVALNVDPARPFFRNGHWVATP